MSKALSLKLREDVFHEAESIRKKRRTPRNAYLNEAVAFYNRLWQRKQLQQALARESVAVASDSREVLEEFEAFQDELLE